MTQTGTALPRVVVLLTALAVMFFLLLASRVQAGSELRPTAVHVVQTGETLWDIASQSAEEGEDIRILVWDLQRLNGLTTSEIDAGDRILLPGDR